MRGGEKLQFPCSGRARTHAPPQSFLHPCKLSLYSFALLKQHLFIIKATYKRRILLHIKSVFVLAFVFYSLILPLCFFLNKHFFFCYYFEVHVFGDPVRSEKNYILFSDTPRLPTHPHPHLTPPTPLTPPTYAHLSLGGLQ